MLYIHEGSEERRGSEISGALSALCAKLADADVPVLNVCTLARNFMLVREAVSERALSTLRSTVEASHDAGNVVPSSLAAPAGVRLRLMRPHLAICTLRLDQLPAVSHALLQLFFFLEEVRGSWWRPVRCLVRPCCRFADTSPRCLMPSRLAALATRAHPPLTAPGGGLLPLL